ncbi:exodeoxyribonuclease VII large subunit [Lachnoclostridium phytofermentans]|uniref:Exodeoxyribonuclease 7 large subunit n=1 Tax=Lachnoclostridium phytofermentans (strain ATCC 700394 / DSM 18823 / ISDg) TaxID=357809 RepID=EX7L_LACP7|nr:exodeoxyribonuclease VII large subunit [Lachnoclostridium phytofermentans]A9KMC1.1 RecName: Full=Exodeoxyribonuclease 7 large subunit; AltName: Full=Exodeoxyribonuclease VII large subunit; Short=Exonuclease VII large subunit [Lachnoclostridium phytofermentans ISDg]ABX42875.1 exodeoxyribonuclease VII, large subunit [Lachnoclostridium phytofermentans ISDg]
MEQVYSVTQVNNYIKNMFVKDYVLNRIYMKGEVSNCKYHTSGHIYFTLKDETGQMACVLFAGYRTGLPFRLEEGQSVIVLGSISVYERDGKYQLYAKEIKLDGLGLLYERFELLKRKLNEEGLFDPSHKKTLVPYPRTVGIVTASTGAAIQDIINISKRRNPYVQLVLYPAKVQGEGAAKTIVAGIKALEAKGVDTIIVGRGGGSIEDLWAFNEEMVARAIFDCSIPIISAVGHETDITISDFVSDLRAPTPSAAAELAVPEIESLLSNLVDYHYSLVQCVMRKITMARSELEKKQLQLTHLSPVYALRQKRQYTIDLENKLRQRMNELIRYKRHLLDIQIERLKAASPLDKLKSGFSYVSDSSGKVVNSITKTKPGDELTIAVTDGMIKAKTIGVESIER